jgi:Mg-chelatase subunit ChlD
MPNNNPNRPLKNRAWRDGAAAAKRRPTGERAWQRDAAAVGTRPRFSRRMQIGVALGLMTVVAVVLVLVYLFYHPTQPFRLVIVTAGYQQNLSVPHNVAGVHDADGLQELSKGLNAAFGNKADAGKVDVQRKTLAGDANPVGDALTNCTSETVVVFIAAHGGADKDGPYLLPDDAGEHDADVVYRVEKVLAALNGLPKKTKKLLLIDATQLGDDWTERQLHNDFVRSLKRMEDRIKEVSNLAVLCSSDEHQRSWASEQFRTTAFAHFAIEGLKGAADLPVEGADQKDCNLNDTRVSALELVRYVQFEVERWARNNRARLQKPLFLGDPAQAAAMELVSADSASYAPPPAAAMPTFPAAEDLKELERAWKRRFDLENEAQPSAYAPLLWRRYQAALLRYEELLRADDKDAAAKMKGVVDALAERVEKARRRDDCGSATTTLAAPTALGWELSPRLATDLDVAVRDLWGGRTPAHGETSQYRSVADGVLKKAPVAPGDRDRTAQLLNLRLSRRVLDSVKTQDDFTKASDILATLFEASARRPAEAHFAVMIRTTLRDESLDVNWDRLAQALRVRLAAEEAALGLKDVAGPRKEDEPPAYSEQVLPWIRDAVEKGDRDRRNGENLLFAKREDAAAKKALDDAEAAYADAQTRARTVRAALQARDQALSDLPYYTDWLAHRTFDGEEVEKPEEERLVKLWAAAHELSERLKQRAGDGKDLIDATRSLREGLNAEQDALRKVVKDQPRTAYQKNWHDIEALLSLPFLPPDQRTALLADQSLIAHTLNANTDKADATQGETEKEAAERAKSRGFREARLAAAELGKDGTEATHRLALVDPNAWEAGLDYVGEAVGAGFRALADDAGAKTDKARKEPPKDGAAALREADLLARRLDAGAADARLKDVDPVEENRVVQLHDLLLWQGERTYLDYWTAEDRTNPYYRAAGHFLVADAGALVAGGANLSQEQTAARTADCDALQRKLLMPDDVTPVWRDAKAQPGDGPRKGEVVYIYNPESKILHVTDETVVERVYGLRGTKGTPPGRPVVWALEGKRLKADPVADAPRALAKLSDDPKDSEVAFTLVPDRPAEISAVKEDVHHVVKGVFRGRTFQIDTTVRLHYRPDLTAYQPEMPKEALVSVQATRDEFAKFAAKNSEIVIVVDFSGSMTTPVKGTNKDRREVVLDALRKCMKEVPAGVPVSLLTFSTEQDGGQITKRWNKVPWDPRASAVDQQMKILEKLDPKYDTPLVASMETAKDSFTKDFLGARTLLVLTDGGDNKVLRGEAIEARSAAMAKKLRDAYGNSGVLVRVIGFRLAELANQDEIDGAQSLDKALKAMETVDGLMVRIEDSDKLAAEMAKYLQQIRYFVEPEADASVIGGLDGQSVSLNVEDLRPIRVPAAAGYFIRLKSYRKADKANRKLLEQRIAVERGDDLVLNLRTSGEGFELRRDVYAKSSAVRNFNPPLAEKQPEGTTWLMAVLGSQKSGGSSAGRKLMVTVEREDGPIEANKSVRQPRPSLIWFNVKSAADGEPVSGLRFHPLPHYPAPAWSLDLSEWPSGAAPLIEAWWNESEPPEAAVLERRLLGSLNRLKQLPIEVRPIDQESRTTVVVESVGWEPREVEVEPGKFVKDVDCLVVRLRYESGAKPFFVQLPPEVAVAGHEHRFYTEAGKYTGIFWNVKKDDVEALSYLKLMSVDKARAKAVRVDGLKAAGDQKPPLPTK